MQRTVYLNRDPTERLENDMESRLPIMNDPEVLRDDWADHPNLSDEQRAALMALSDDTLQEALSNALDLDDYLALLDRTRSDATDALLRTLGLEG